MRRNNLTKVVLVITALLCALGLFACSEKTDGGVFGSNINGTYYHYADGTWDKSDYVTVNGEKWTSSSGDYGKLKSSGSSVTFYIDLFGESIEYTSGTVSGGVLKIRGTGKWEYYCREGRVPSDTGNEPPIATSSVTVTYNANGGIFADDKTVFTQTTDTDTVLTAPQSPSRKNYHFSGWATSADGNKLWNFATDIVGKDITLYAVWEQQSAVIFSVDGASIDDNAMSVFLLVEHEIDNVSLSNKVVCSNDSIWKLYYDRLGQTEIPTKIAAGRTGELANGDNVFYIVVTSANGTQVNTYTLTVHRSYLVNINFYDNKEKMINQDEVYTGHEYIVDYTPTIDGYVFNYWKNAYDNETTKITPYGKVDLYADCTARKYNAFLDTNGGNEVSKTEYEVTYDESYSFNVPTRTGYSFLGWYDGNTQVTYSSGRSMANWTYTNSKTLRAKWQANSYRVSLYTNDSKAGTVSGGGNYDYDSSVTVTATTNSGYTWLGWYDGNNELVTMDLSYSFKMGFATSYTAKWMKCPITVQSSNASIGWISGLPNCTVVGAEYTLTANCILGYYLTGWYTGETRITSNKSIQITMPLNSTTTYTYTAKFEVDSQMSNFTFTSTADTCEIKGIKDATVTEIIVPNYVTSIAIGAFARCYSLESITIPFVGLGQKAIKIPERVFGAIFDYYSTTSISSGIGSTLQYSEQVSGENNRKYYFYNIPQSIRKVIITQTTYIPNNAFYNCSKLTSIEIPNSVTSIGSSAFYNCSGLTSIVYTGDIKGWCEISGLNDLMQYGTATKTLTMDGIEITGVLVISNSVTSIPSYAFSGCSGLTSVTIGNSVTSIGDYAFRGCSSLETVYWNATACSSAGSSSYPIFSNCSKLATVIIGDNVTSIPSNALYNCSSLTSIEIPNSVTSIGDYAFYNCSNLTIYCEAESRPSGWSSSWNPSNRPVVWNCKNNNQDENGFWYAVIDGIRYRLKDGIATVIILHSTAMEAITIPSNVTYNNEIYSVTSIGSYAFRGCSSLTSVTIGNSVTSIGSSAFSGCSGLTSITIPNSVTSIGSSAFSGCSGLTSVTIGNGVTSIESSAFYGCSGLETVYWNATAYTSAGSSYNYIFSNCSKLATVIIGDNVTSIPSYAFSGCSGLTSITIPNSVTSIGSNAFYNCSGLTSITIPNSVTSIGSNAFYNCSGLETVYWNATACTSAGSPYNYIFSNCSKLATVIIGDNVTSIPSHAFSGCSGLTSVTIPNSVTSIGDEAFFNCSGLTSVTIGNSVTSIGDEAFFGCRRLTSIEIPNSVTSIGSHAFYDCSGLTSITIPNSVTNIGDYAFRGCSSLTSVTIGNSVTSIGSNAFYNCRSLTRVYYKGTANEWAKISINSSNSELTAATRYYYSETQPTSAGNYWHYDEDGKTPVVW